MSGLAARVDRPIAPQADAPAKKPALTEAQRQVLLRMAAFMALAVFSAAHWFSVVQHPPLGRAAALLALCCAGGLLLWLTGELRLPEWAVRVAAALVVLAMVVAGLLVTGLHAHYLAPRGWGALERGINHGLLDAQSAVYPYQGKDPWVRLTLLLGAPAFLVPATALAFWPARRFGGALRAVSLVVLLVLYGMALAERSPGGQIGRGAVLLLLIAAWLWLPRLSTRDAGGAAAAVVAAALVALPVAVALDGDKGWLDYRNWRVLGDKAGIDYRWNHTYGPIDWPRRGTTLMYVRADRPYYWKAETLNDFDGKRWFRSGEGNAVSSASELPAPPNRKWMKKIEVTVAALRGTNVIGAGTPQSVSGAGDTGLAGDGTVTATDHPLRDGENYTVDTYIPQPTVAEMRATPPGYEGYFSTYTRITLPVKLGSRTDPHARIDPSLWGEPGSGDPFAATMIKRSPYARMYGLARRLTASAPTPYDAVRRIERYLATTRFAYDEHPAVRRYPLESFLFKDRVGYCQQFSGTLALMLRMVGIPARVATGFAPGTPQPDAPGVYRVRDLDAHSWVEVYFAGIGWVTFDPTPAVSPASSQSDDRGGGISGRGPTPRGLGQSQGPDPVGERGSVDLGTTQGSGLEWWMIPAGVATLLALLLVAYRVRRAAQIRAAIPPDDRAVEDLIAALTRLGNPVPAGATLTGVERILERRAGPDAGRYARLIREYRYGANGGALPDRRDRRLLRRALAATTHPFGRLKTLRALPPFHF